MLFSFFLFLSLSFSPPGSKPKASDANFDDLLSGQGFAGTKEKKGPRTIAEMRKEEMAKEMDPEKLKAGAAEKHLSSNEIISSLLFLFASKVSLRNSTGAHDSIQQYNWVELAFPLSGFLLSVFPV